MNKYLSKVFLLLISFFVLTNVNAQEQSKIKSVSKINSTTYEIIFENNEKQVIDFYSDNIFRLFKDTSGRGLRKPQAKPEANILVDNPRKNIISLATNENDTTYNIETSKIKISFNKNTGLFKVFDIQKNKYVLSQTKEISLFPNKSEIILNSTPDEYFYGGGVQNGRFSHKGKTIAIENSNNWVDGGVASPTPFYWSTNGYAVMWYTFKKGKYDFGETEKGKVILSHQEPYFDVFFMINSNGIALLNDYYQLTGNPVLMPKFGFYQGHLNAYNRDYWKVSEKGILLEDGKYYSEAQKDNGGVKESLNGENNNYMFSARAAIDRYTNNDMPLGWFIPNDGYGAGYGQTGTLDGNIKNLAEFRKYANSKGVELGLWTQSDLHPKEGVEALLQRDIIKEVRDAGVRVLKTDVAWVGPGYSFGLNGVADVAQVMPKYGNNARPFIISLDGWAGTQRYATIWSGDQTGGEWEYIRFHIPTFIGSGLSGQPNITSDVDGIFGGKKPIINVREFQWKTFTPMELNMDGWGANPKYPHALGEPATSINRMYLKMKAVLMPYVYSIAKEAVNGKPMIRAMFLEYPNEYTLGRSTQYQFFYGPYFLIAPIYKNTDSDTLGNDIRNNIYLPEGKWIDYLSGRVYEGNTIVNNYESPIWKLPIFVKSDAIIPVTNPNNNPNEIRKDYRGYEIYAENGAQFTHYDDDGVSTDYLSGKGTTTNIFHKVNNGTLEVSVNKTEGDFNGFVKEQESEFFINLTQKPKKVSLKINNKNVKLKQAKSIDEYNSKSNVYFYQARPNLNTFATKGEDFEKVEIIKNPVLMVKLAKEDITKSNILLAIKGFTFNPDNHLLKSSGALATPQMAFVDTNVTAYTITPTWNKVDNADYYEIEKDGLIYSTINRCNFSFDELTPLTTYNLKIRSVNKDGYSNWGEFSVKTKINPLEYAIKNIVAQTSCSNQPGAGINKLFDLDEKTMWHTEWSKKAVPFSILIDLQGINTLDKFTYIPRSNAGNGTITKATYSYSTNKKDWSSECAINWVRDNKEKLVEFKDKPQARYIRINVSEAVGDFGAANEMYVFKVPNTKTILQGDINNDNKIDENDLTSYMNYTGLRPIDADYEYIKIGDINQNGLIDAFDISNVAVRLENGVRTNILDSVSGALKVNVNKKNFKKGEEVIFEINGVDLKNVNALSFALPYSSTELEFVKITDLNVKGMLNLTNDRLHSNGEKSLYPTFVNIGNKNVLNGNEKLFVIKFRAKKDGKVAPDSIKDIILVDKNLGTQE